MNTIDYGDILIGSVAQRMPQAPRALSGARTPDDPESRKLLDACREFESIFLGQMLSSMRKTVDRSGLVDGGMAEDVFEDLLYDEYAKIISKTGSFGIADLMYSRLSGPTALKE